MWILYQIAVAALSLLVSPVLLLARGRHYGRTLHRRLGFHDADSPAIDPLWIHAVSVGEVGVAAALARALPESSRPWLVTTVTPTGQARAHASFPDATVTYLPFELGLSVRRFFRRFHPRALILSEGDLWPLVLRECRRRRLPVLVVNGRVSDRSFRRMHRLRRWLGPILEPVDHFAVQSELDGERLRSLGVPGERITVTGNLKFETPEPEPHPELEARLSALAAGRPILMAGSTMRGEEEAVLEAFAAAGGGDRGLLILAPRHPERWDPVAALLQAGGWNHLRRSDLDGGPDRPAVILLDSLGELAALYRLARGSFIGGTLVASGGHNPVEAARFGIPVAAGPSMENFREIADLFDRAGAWQRVADADALSRAWSSWIDDGGDAARLGRRGSELVARHRGALGRTLEVARRTLAESLEPAP